MKRNRDYRREYDTFHKKPLQKKRRAARNTARAQAVKKGQVHKGDGKDVHHRDGNPQNNSAGNKSIMSKSRNRSIQ